MCVIFFFFFFKGGTVDRTGRLITSGAEREKSRSWLAF